MANPNEASSSSYRLNVCGKVNAENSCIVFKGVRTPQRAESSNIQNSV